MKNLETLVDDGFCAALPPNKRLSKKKKNDFGLLELKLTSYVKQKRQPPFEKGPKQQKTNTDATQASPRLSACVQPIEVELGACR